MMCSKCYGKGVIYLQGELKDRLLFLRDFNNLSVRELEDRTGINYQTLNRAEHGKSELSIMQVKTLAKFYGVSIDELVNESEDGGSK